MQSRGRCASRSRDRPTNCSRRAIHRRHVWTSNDLIDWRRRWPPRCPGARCCAARRRGWPEPWPAGGRAGAGQPKRSLCHATGDPASPWVSVSVADPAAPVSQPVQQQRRARTTPLSVHRLLRRYGNGNSRAAPGPVLPRWRPLPTRSSPWAVWRLRRAHDHHDHHHDHADADARANPVLEPGGLPRRLWVRLCVRETRRGHVLF